MWLKSRVAISYLLSHIILFLYILGKFRSLYIANDANKFSKYPYMVI